MTDTESLLNRWQSAGVLDADTAARIRALESETTAKDSPALHWQGITALILGAILLACGVALFVSAHWRELSPGARLLLVFAMVAVFHLAAGFTRDHFRSFSTALHAVGTLSVGPAIALVGQIFHLQEHWPTAVLLWALAAIAGWVLLRDQAQQTIALLLIPAWLVCEFAYRSDQFIGQDVYLGRILLPWAVLYLTFFVGYKRKAVQGILFAAAAIAAVAGTVMMLLGWQSFFFTQTFLPFSTRFWAWVAIAALPLLIAAFHGHKGIVPIAVSILYAVILPWCTHSITETYRSGVYTSTWTRTEPNLFAHLLVAAFAVFLSAWGVRLASRALVNFGIVAFAIAVGWFYFSNIFTALGRSLGLIGLGVLFLAGGWALEMTRRRILGHMTTAEAQ